MTTKPQQHKRVRKSVTALTEFSIVCDPQAEELVTHKHQHTQLSHRVTAELEVKKLLRTNFPCAQKAKNSQVRVLSLRFSSPQYVPFSVVFEESRLGTHANWLFGIVFHSLN